MALITLEKNFGKGSSHLDKRIEGSLFSIVQELQGLNVAVLNGVAADTNMAVTGIDPDEDTILFTLVFPDTWAAGNPSSATDVTITSAGNVQSATAHTTDTLVVFWYDRIP